MSSILRSSKFFRYFTGFVRNSVLSAADESYILKSQCLSTGRQCLSQTVAVAAAEQQARHRDSLSLEKSLHRLDQDVRRSGRISRRELEDVLGELRQTSSATSSQSLMIIRCCGSLVPEESPHLRTQLVQQIWETLSSMGVPMDVSHYNALLRVYLENEHPFSPPEVLAELERKGIEPNRVTYQRLVTRYCQQADMDGATQVLQFMREKQLPVNETVFNALLMGHCQADDMDSAASILGVMRQAGLEPSADTYTTLMSGHAKRGDMAAIEATLRECEAKDVCLLDRDYMDVIYALAAGGKASLDDTAAVLAKMRHSMGYNHDATNLILRLVNAGRADVGLQALRTMPRATTPDGGQVAGGAFFVRHLVKCGRPLAEIVETCGILEADGINDRALSVAAERSLQLGDADLAFGLLAAMKRQGLPLRQHYFWPLLAAHAKAKNVAGALQVVGRMISEVQMPPSGETLRDHVVDVFPRDMPADRVVMELRSAGVTPGAAASALVCHLLSHGKMAEAAEVASRYPTTSHYPWFVMRRPMSTALAQTGDVASYATLLRHVSAGANTPADLTCQFLCDVAGALHRDRAATLPRLLQAVLDQGLSLSSSSAVRLGERLADDMTPEISGLVALLTAEHPAPGQAAPATLAAANTPRMPQMDIPTLEKLAASRDGDAGLGVRKQLLSAYCRAHDLERAEAARAALEADGVALGGGMLAQLVELYAHHERLEEALSCHRALAQREPAFALDDSKVVKLAALLVKNDRFADAIALLTEERSKNRRPLNAEQPFMYTNQCWRMLNSLAEAGQVDQVNELFKVLVDSDYVTVSNVLLGPLVKVHVVRGDLSGAMAAFEWCCQSHRATPWKNDLACKLIAAEDAAALQRLTDLSTAVHGEVNSLYDLVFAFVECGRIRQAKKILETPGLGSRPQRITAACRRYKQEQLVAPLEGLIEATKDISHIVDRSHIYTQLLQSYCKSNEVDKALGLWTQMQEEDVATSDEFLISLAALLKANEQPVPFAVPVAAASPPPRPAAASRPAGKPERAAAAVSQSQSSPAALLELRRALKSGELDAVLAAKKKAEAEGASPTARDLSLVVELLVKSDRLGEAATLALAMLGGGGGGHPLPRVLRFLLNKLALAGDVDTVTAMGEFLTQENKKMLSFNNRLCNAIVVAGQAAGYVAALQQEAADAKESDLPLLAETFPKGGAIAILQRHPELARPFEDMARTYAVRGITAPINVLWMHLFASGSESEAGQLWSEFLARSPSVMFQHVAQTARKAEDAQLATRLVNQLVGTSVSEGGVGNAYSLLIDVLVAKGEIDQASKTLENALKDVCLEHLNTTTLNRLSEAVTAQGKNFSYSIPDKNRNVNSSSSSSSSSSSDDDEKTNDEKTNDEKTKK